MTTFELVRRARAAADSVTTRTQQVRAGELLHALADRLEETIVKDDPVDHDFERLGAFVNRWLQAREYPTYALVVGPDHAAVHDALKRLLGEGAFRGQTYNQGTLEVRDSSNRHVIRFTSVTTCRDVYKVYGSENAAIFYLPDPEEKISMLAYLSLESRIRPVGIKRPLR